MSIVVSFTVPGSTLPMTRALDAIPGGEVEVDRVIDREEHVAPMFWVDGGDIYLEDFERALRAQEQTEDVVKVDDVGTRRLYRLDWVPEDGLFDAITSTEGTVLAATGTADVAEVVVRFPDETAAEQFLDQCEDADIPIRDVERADLHEALDGIDPTDTEFLIAAVEAGYFSGVASVEEVADELGVEASKLAERLDDARKAVVDAIEN